MNKPICIPLILTALLLMVTLGSATTISYAFFHDAEPEKPNIGALQLNPVITAELNKLYNKDPHQITQQDIDASHTVLVNDCLNHQQDDSMNFMSLFVCRALSTGLMQSYLTQMGVNLEPSTAEYGNVGKSPQLMIGGGEE